MAGKFARAPANFDARRGVSTSCGGITVSRVAFGPLGGMLAVAESGMALEVKTRRNASVRVWA